MKISLLSILTFVAIAQAKFHGARSPSGSRAHARANAARAPSGSNGEQIPTIHVRKVLTTRFSVVIAQMFEWTWDSVAAECTTFLGPAGYGFVQGELWKPINVPARRVLTIFQ
jgi:hypothetical protein